jgi:hypothetical protein
VNSDLMDVLAAAMRAPSGDNTQPWRFTVNEVAQTIDIRVDETRDPSPMNAGQRMSRIACGMAAENIAAAAYAYGFETEVKYIDQQVVRARLHSRRIPKEDPRADRTVAERCTNRKRYDARPLPADAIAELVRSTPILDDVAVHWVHERKRIERLADLVGRADAAMFGEPSMRAAFLHNVRFDVPGDAETDEGLSLNSIEVFGPQRLALRGMPKMPQWLLRISGTFRMFAAQSRMLLRSASGFCVIASADRTPLGDFKVGRSTERAWLALTKRRLAAQPMMSLLCLANILEHGDAALIERAGRKRISALMDEFRAQVPEVGTRRPSFLLRFGYGDAPSGRTGRRPLEAALDA